MKNQSQLAQSVQSEIFVISGPSGVGKTSCKDRLLLAGISNLRYSTSWTTRQPRPDDKEGAYKYVSNRQFTDALLHGEFAEYNDLHQACYGTPWSELVSPGIVIVDIDVDGCRQLREYRELEDRLTAIFIEPACLNNLRAQLQNRGGMSDKEIQGRMNRVQYEVNIAKKHRPGEPKPYDHFVKSYMGKVDELYTEVLRIILKKSGRDLSVDNLV